MFEMESASFRWKEKEYLEISPRNEGDKESYDVIRPFELKSISIFVEKVIIGICLFLKS